jgi:SAM-dependent methyltransferase
MAVAVPRKLDVGAGFSGPEGYERLDKTGVYGAEHIHDITDIPWPFADNTFAALNCTHILEHIDRSRFIDVMNEMHRVLEPGGELDIEVPIAPHWKAFADPTHVSYFVPQTFVYFAGAATHKYRTLYGIRPWEFELGAYSPPNADGVDGELQFRIDEGGGIMALTLIKPREVAL